MSQSDIITAQYAHISQSTASLGDRCVASLIDALILSGYTFLWLYLLMETNFGISRWVTLLLYFLPTTFYSFLCEYLFRGQTIGKMVRHTRVVSADGSQPTIGQLLLRWMCLSVDVWVCCVGIVVIVVTRRHQRLGDLAAGTMVIREDDYQKWHVSLDDFYYLRPDYRPVYPEAQNLSTGQADVIERTIYAEGGYDEEQVERLSQKVAHFLGIKPKESAPEFLTTVLHDYQYYALQVV